MEIISQHAKKIMEECKIRARDQGLRFDDETLEYIVTNRNMIELSPKGMIPTLYDYWVNDVEVLKGQGKYKLYPNNPYETVINSRPAISFYNDNNPDWLNIMIFYHVLGHIDFFQNNFLFKQTWNDDFVGQALADKRLIENLRSEHGRWLDYIIEFSRAINNLVGYFGDLLRNNLPEKFEKRDKINFYFENFLQDELKKDNLFIFNEINIFNNYLKNDEILGETLFLSDVKNKFPEFNLFYEKNKNVEEKSSADILEFIRDNSPFLNKDKNNWMKSVLNIIRNTSLYFAPQIRTKTINEGWASYWHDNLFRKDERIKGHEVAYAKINSQVTSISRIGLNPYAIGLRLFEYIGNLADKGKMNFDFQKINNIEQRDLYDKNTSTGKDTIFNVRRNFSDFTFLNTFIDQDFVDEYNLFVVGKRVNPQKRIYEYYIKSRKAEDYKDMIINSLYHPPIINVDIEKTKEGNLYLTHKFEYKQLIKEFIADTLIGIEYLWGNQVQLETTEIYRKTKSADKETKEYEYRKVLYTVKDKKVSKQNL
ncbi:MAG: SpoVR family protein [Bacteroidales bacterium]|nr:SpoVR family protein [Bacteroidales bacterium]MBN2756303.1 SpoVR family protein [Bacteroidales bacterium]